MTYDTLAYWAKMGGTVVFTIIFLMAVIYALWPSNKAKFEHAAHMPLSDDDQGPEV